METAQKDTGATRKSVHSRSRLLEEMGIKYTDKQPCLYAGSIQVHVLCVQHCNGIQALRIHNGNLYSASRDSTIKRWGLRDDHLPVLRGSFEGHCDWVNDITFVEQYLASASSDGTVKLWRSEKRTCILTLTDHTDYVSCLASAPGHSILTSAGLRSEIFLYDLEVGDTSHGRWRLPWCGWSV